MLVLSLLNLLFDSLPIFDLIHSFTILLFIWFTKTCCVYLSCSSILFFASSLFFSFSSSNNLFFSSFRSSCSLNIYINIIIVSYLQIIYFTAFCLTINSSVFSFFFINISSCSFLLFSVSLIFSSNFFLKYYINNCLSYIIRYNHILLPV